MLGDILLITDQHKEAAATLFEMLGSHKKTKPIIAVSGESGSGKSELSHALAKKIKESGKKAKLIHTDNFYLTLPEQRTRVRKETGIAKAVGPQEYDWDAINAVIKAFRKGDTIAMPCVDLLTDQVDILISDMSEVHYLILDGLYAVKTRGTDLRIFIDIPYHMTKKAQLLRGKENVDETRSRILEAEHLAVTALKKKATHIIDPAYKVHIV